MDWACPTHRLRLTTDLRCPKGCHYLLKRGVPRFAASGYTEAFGFQWLNYRRTQLDSATGTHLSEERLRRCVGEELWDELPGKRVLEVGCGAGRFTEVLLSKGADLVSVDLSDAVDANALNFPGHTVAQADLFALPFVPQTFDVVICLGVIQHTPDSERAIAALWDQVAPGGTLVIDHYRLSLSYLTKTAPLFRAVLKRMKPEASLRAVNALVDTLLPIHQRAGALSPLLTRLSPVMAYYRSLPLTEQQHREWAMLDTYDSLTCWHKRYRTVGQIARCLEGLQATDIHCVKGGNGVEARAKRSVRVPDAGHRIPREVAGAVGRTDDARAASNLAGA